MKKMILAALMLGLSACSTLSKPDKTAIPKELFLGKWVCTIKYDDLKVVTMDISDFRENGEIHNKGMIFDTNFSPITFSYDTKDQGKWFISGNRLTIDYDLTKREVTRATSQKTLELLKQKKYQSLAKYEKSIFNLLSKKEKSKEDVIVLEILDFRRDHLKIRQEAGKNFYQGECLTLEKAAVIAKSYSKHQK